jgi:hypothetical protein
VYRENRVLAGKVPVPLQHNGIVVFTFERDGSRLPGDARKNQWEPGSKELTMAKSSRHRGAFIFGSVLGGAVGAAAALWNTPQSGTELRRTLGLEREPAPATAGLSSSSAPGGSLQDKALGLLEQATAPLVGVKLGQTANNSQPGMGPATLPTRPATSPAAAGISGDATEPVAPEGV